MNLSDYYNHYDEIKKGIKIEDSFNTKEMTKNQEDVKFKKVIEINVNQMN